MPRVNSLSIFLITKNDFTKYKDLVIDGLSTKPIVLKEGELFYKTSDKDYYPSWVDGFFGVDVLGDYRKKLGTKTLSAVYFTSITIDEVKRTFAVTFGNGRYLIKKGCIQHGFGLNTSRHAIDALRITSMRTTTYDSNIKDKTIRSTSEIRQSEYFLNMDTDVLTAVSGKVREEGTGDLLQNRIIGGKDSVSMTAYVDVSNLSKFLKQLYAQYINDGLDGVNYKSNIRILEGEEEVAAAENLLQIAIDNYKTEDKVYLNLPLYDLEKNDKITGYKIDGVVYEDLTTNILDKYDTIKKLRTTVIEIIDEEDDIWERHLFDFLYAELDDGENCYILADGEFYQIEKSYKKRVDDFYDRAKIETIAGVSQWDGCIEGEYNKNQTAANILVMDEVFVHPEGNNKFEVCDLLTDDRHIIHVKIFDIASQPLGHLFNQGMLSAQCMADESIRKKIQAKIAGLTTKEIFYMPVPFEASNYIVTFLILCKDKKSVDGYGRPKIPFLARAVFKESCTTINNLGYNVVLSSLVKV